jgi:hypothetical protein
MRTPIKITLFVVFFLAVAGIGVALYLYNLKPADLQNSKSDFAIMAPDLAKAFKEDMVGANEKYVNKTIDVTGIIQYAGTGTNGILSIALEGFDFSNIICTFPVTPDNMPTDVGLTITVRGRCSGYLMDILLNDCVFVI